MNITLKGIKQPALPTLAAAYEALIAERGLKDDPAQRNVIDLLQGLMGDVSENGRSEPSLLNKLLGKANDKALIMGVYIWGNVGRGKSMLMDLFFHNAPVVQKRRVHFHAFMQEVHAGIHQLRQEAQKDNSAGDPVQMLAQKIAAETQLLCFDELQATDVADATLLYRLFQALWEHGVVIVSTSNHPPESLYTGGIQKERFNNFIALIKERMHIVPLSSPHDYRHLKVKSFEKRYFYPLGSAADAFIKQTLENLASNITPVKETLAIQGRKLEFMLYDSSIGRFTFKDLCETSLGAADYLAIAKRCDTVILTGIPALPPEKRNEAKRFVTLIDAFYEHKIDLICTAAVSPEQIYVSGDGSFEFGRTVSRLSEMQSAEWGD